MRRCWWSRSLTAVLGLWLALVVGDPGILHVWAMRGTAMTADMMAGHAMDGHVIGGHMMADQQTGDRRTSSHEHDACCIGCCVGVTVAVLLTAAPTTTFAAALIPTPITEHTPVGLLPRPGPRYSRPYTTGPPRA